MNDVVERQRESQRLQSAGWKEAAGVCHGLPLWRDPEGGQIWSQEEAIHIMTQRESEGGACG